MRRLLSAFCLLAALGLAAPAYAKFKVVTTFTVIQDIAQNVAGDAAVVESITKPGAEIHDYQPTPQDIAKAQSADLGAKPAPNTAAYCMWIRFPPKTARCPPTSTCSTPRFPPLLEDLENNV